MPLPLIENIYNPSDESSEYSLKLRMTPVPAFRGNDKISAERCEYDHTDHTRGYQKVLSLRHFPHSDSTMLHT